MATNTILGRPVLPGAPLPSDSLTALAAAVGVLRPSTLTPLLRHLPTSYTPAFRRAAGVTR
ncbi:hypothetical protein [Streptomyces sp. NPDC058418]|uniref:hypothetical protein n=1 Tax=Streptomyces sp. NPDC058418 TaxID=3346488 RepID=UPI0036523D99